MGLEASILVPVHNEVALLERNTRILVEYLSGAFQAYELILVENGSIDQTLSVARGLAATLGHVHVLEIPEPSLGEALKLGVTEARHDKVVYFPIDLSTDLDFIPKSVERLDDFDMVVGSKRMKPGLDRRPLHRRLLSCCYHGLVRGLFRTGFTDTTCVKAFRRDRVLQVFGEVPSSSQVFETEMMLAAQRLGLRILEIAVEVRGSRPSRQSLGVKVRSKLRDIVSLRVDVMAFWFGGLAVVSGLVLLGYLSIEKVQSGQPGFLNPYSFLLAMLLVVSGLQMIVFGLQASLLLQVRRTVESIRFLLNRGDEPEEE